MLAIHFPSSPIDARTPSPPTSYHADYCASAPLLAPPPPPVNSNKRRAGPPKLSLQITSETRRTFSKSSIPPVSTGPLSPTSLSTQRNTQFNARRDAVAPTSFSAAPIEPRMNGNGKRRRSGSRSVGFAEGVEVIGYSVRWEDQQQAPRHVEEESSSSSSSEDDEEEVRARKVGGNLRGLEQMEALKLGRGSSRGYNWRMKMLNATKSSSLPTTTDEVTEPMSAAPRTRPGGVGFGFGGGIGRFS